MGIERKSQELHNRLVNCYESTHTHICGTRKCDLCLCEKLMIARANSASLLIQHDELASKCPHMNKFTLKCFKNT